MRVAKQPKLDCLLGRQDSNLCIRDLCPAGFTAVTYRARACWESGARSAATLCAGTQR
jgi:hypothetical protein